MSAVGDCCQQKSCDLEKLRKDQARVLWIALFINGAMFFTELIGGILSDSLALTGDSLDMLGDAIAYGSSLYVIYRSMRAKALSAALKGLIMIFSAMAVCAQAVWKLTHLQTPQVGLMGTITVLALVANLICLYLLTRHRYDDVNMSSVWLCSRNDLIANSSVLIAAGVVAITNSPWPDIIVGAAITALFFRSGLGVLRNARKELSTT